MMFGKGSCLVVAFLALALQTSNAGTVTEHITTQSCENKDLALECAVGHVINVIEASYGRSDNDICPGKGAAEFVGTCHSDTSRQVLDDSCNGQNSCKVAATNAVFSDPCRGTYKYLEVEYVCVPEHHTTHTCEKNDLVIECEVGQVINVVQASYGRSNNDICPGPNAAEFVGTCHSDTSRQVLDDSCNGQKSCKVAATNAVFGDPCRNTYKYLEVEYVCVPEHHTTYTCEKDDLALECEVGHVINVIEASYGRSDNDICPGKGAAEFAGTCHSDTSRQVLDDSCNGQASCKVAATNAVFSDPCRGTYKYLEVEYVCVPETNEPHCDWPNGQIYWPHTSDCHMFIQCSPHGPTEMQCASGTAWSQSLLTCDYVANTDC